MSDDDEEERGSFTPVSGPVDQRIAGALEYIAKQLGEINRKLKLLWIGCGKDDSLMAANQAFGKFLTAHEVKFTFHESEGAHTWLNWRDYLAVFAPQLFQPQRSSSTAAAR